MQVFRSMLFTPANRLDLVAKALASETDAVIADLEDAVPAAAKHQARENLGEIGPTETPLFVRVNGAETEHLWPDVVAAGRAGVAGVVVPKADDPDLLRQIDGALTALEIAAGRPVGSTSLVPLIESSLGVMRASALMSSSRRIEIVVFGSGEQGDLVADLGCEWTPDGTALLTARSLVLIAARGAGIQGPMDAVFMDFKNLDALRVECELARRVGYVGKVAIHPAQLAVIHDVFTPSAEEVAHNERIVRLFDEAVSGGSASINVDGRMVDYAVARQAQGVLQRAARQEA